MTDRAAIVSVYVTTADAAEAGAIARAVVEARLAACANVIPLVQSIYRWDGAVVDGSEAAVIFKTRAALVPALEARVRELHSYEVPCVVVWPIVGGAADYMDWVLAETAGG
ncbi:divalent-cation tolerance protein CutA [Govanella unica]|uniref:Divalent-cation tolerance protein CutA n=1 Tax=Govanella unica TaxID=2975056 RepID=A0A9X3TYM3_9PROT|nr:divalent-cation tolerance protein CutA [Govania unica]MDA5194110.1 divalent-cation tolerance protein CutA [Govania unica]